MTMTTDFATPTLTERLAQAQNIMDQWSRWMASDLSEIREHWYPSVAAGFDQAATNWAVSVDDMEHAYDGLQQRSVAACDAVIDDLRRTAPHLVWAINKTHGLSRHIEYCRRSVLVDYCEAVRAVCKALVERGIIE